MRRIRKSIHTKIYDFTSIEGILSGVHYEKGFAIAMDRRLFALIKERYDASKENKTYNMYGIELVADYPNWRRILNQVEESAKLNIPKTFLCNFSDIDLFYQDMDADTKNMEHLLNNYFVVCDDIYFLATEFRRYADMMQTYSMNELNVCPYDELNGTRASFSCNDNGLLAIMPTKLYKQVLYEDMKTYPLSRLIKFDKSLINE